MNSRSPPRRTADTFPEGTVASVSRVSDTPSLLVSDRRTMDPALEVKKLVPVEMPIPTELSERNAIPTGQFSPVAKVVT